MLTQSRLRELLDYYPEDGIFRWKRPRTYTAARGSVAGCRTSTGYIRIKVNGVEQLAHRLAWLYVHGKWPSRSIDHINGCRDDNRLCNLRLADFRQQRANAKLNCNNSSGFRGVYWNKRRQKWRAHIQREHLGFFATKEDAAAAVATAFNNRYGVEWTYGR
jgi:hypothetical protein